MQSTIFVMMIAELVGGATMSPKVSQHWTFTTGATENVAAGAGELQHRQNFHNI